jgi:GDP-D-mannose 3', 5'-epimerase
MKTALVLGAGGFIGSHLVKRLKSEGYWVRGVDLKYPEFGKTEADDFVIADLRDVFTVGKVMFGPDQKRLKDENAFDEVYQLAADMGGAGFVFTGENDSDIMHNSAQINLNVADRSVMMGVKKLFYSSSACMYPAHNQTDPNNPNCSEESAYPAAPDSEYGWEKLFSERLYLAYARNKGLNIRIARFHNIFGPEGTWIGGREKAPAAICRKVIEATDKIEIWGPGTQTRSFLYVDECVEGIRRLMASNFRGPVNIGSDEMVSINQLVEMAMSFENKQLEIVHIKGPIGVAGRNSDNRLIQYALGWAPSYKLIDGLKKTYYWIRQMIKEGKKND